MGGNGSGGWVRAVIGIDSGEDFNLPLGRHTSNFLCLPDRDCEVGGPANEVLPQGLRVEILTGLRGKGTPPSRILWWRDPGFPPQWRKLLPSFTSP